MDGMPPLAKKRWLDRSKIGTPSDPVRGTAAAARMAGYERIGVRAEKAPCEQDYQTMVDIV